MICQEKGCDKKAEEYRIENSKDEIEIFRLCDKHAQEFGFCPGCGVFYGGCESWEFPEAHGNLKGYCSDCSYSIKMECGDYDDEDKFGYDDEDNWE